MQINKSNVFFVVSPILSSGCLKYFTQSSKHLTISLRLTVWKNIECLRFCVNVSRPLEIDKIKSSDSINSQYYDSIYLINFVNKLLHLRITRAVLDSSSCEREKSKPSSILPSSWRTACFSSTFPTPFFFVS